LRNNLTAGEIAAQVVWARREAALLPATTPRRLGNVVFMGMGEPLANERHVFAALARLTDPRAFAIGGRRITVSTVGIVPGIARRLGAHVNLIPLNPTPGYAVTGSPPARIRRFVSVLERAGVNVTVRDTRGRNIDAACGQLALSAVEGERVGSRP